MPGALPPVAYTIVFPVGDQTGSDFRARPNVMRAGDAPRSASKIQISLLADPGSSRFTATLLPSREIDTPRKRPPGPRPALELPCRSNQTRRKVPLSVPDRCASTPLADTENRPNARKAPKIGRAHV